MTDFLLNDEYDLLFIAGDFAAGNSDVQHQVLLLLTDKGDWKEAPTVGVGIDLWLKDNDGDGLLGEIKKEFERDGLTVKNIEIGTNGKLNIDASYTETPNAI
ncbi:MAG: hypothetical protein ABS68_00295 [Niastella sp. SCN 39-18]|nr:hypothetical protein [Sphingobacteriales bacterium]ODT55191.1 MAG: hypothetical protein ABS68_00295 [Niastella sp. SCN 39-18]OJW09097.1 MAG: hypothetical protein BGO53_00110 [Sphingobacteriales bacterium 39-19]